jgi:hypothetical protein
MNTIVIRMPDAMAREVAEATDILQLPSNEEFAFQAVHLMLRSVLGTRVGRPYKRIPTLPVKPKARRRR